MKKLILWNVITLDGYFEGTKPWDLAFHDLVWGNELEQLSIEQLDSADAIIYGKNTYEGMAKYWSKETGNISDRMNEIKKYVCSRTLKTADWNNTEILHDAVSEIQKLKASGDGTLFVFGSGILTNALMKANLFDEYRLCIAPVILGKGRKLFENNLPYQKLSPLEARLLKTGGVIVRYAYQE